LNDLPTHAGFYRSIGGAVNHLLLVHDFDADAGGGFFRVRHSPSDAYLPQRRQRQRTCLREYEIIRRLKLSARPLLRVLSSDGIDPPPLRVIDSTASECHR